MAIIEIPINPNIEAQTVEVSLDGVLYKLRFSWNIRQSSWSMDIAESNDNILIQGIKIEPDWLPVFRYKITNFPPGEFIVIDTSGTGDPPDRTEFGTGARVKLMYQEAT